MPIEPKITTPKARFGSCRTLGTPCQTGSECSGRSETSLQEQGRAVFKFHKGPAHEESLIFMSSARAAKEGKDIFERKTIEAKSPGQIHRSGIARSSERPSDRSDTNWDQAHHPSRFSAADRQLDGRSSIPAHVPRQRRERLVLTRNSIARLFLVSSVFIASLYTLAFAQASELGKFTDLVTIIIPQTSALAAGVAFDNNGNAYITGDAEDFPVPVDGKKGFHGEDLAKNDIFITKVDLATAKVAWTIRTGTTDDDHGQSIAVDPSGDNLYVAGKTFAQFGSSRYYRQGDVFVIKYNIAGGGKPVREWDGPITFGTSSREEVSDLVVDSTGEFLYLTGITRGSLFRDPPDDGAPSNIDAFLVKMKASDGSIKTGKQFGNPQLDAKSRHLIVPEKEGEPILVGVDAIRAVGATLVENTMLYKFDPISLEPLGSILLRTSAKEQLAGIVRHPLFPKTVFAGARSYLSAFLGWNLALKRISQDVDTTDDIGEVTESVIGLQKTPGEIVGENDYDIRLGSKKDDSASSTAVDPKSGRIWMGGSTPGILASGDGTERTASLSQMVFLVYEPESGAISHVAQQQLGDAEDYASLAGFAFSNDGLSVTYVVTRLEKSLGNSFIIIVGSYTIPTKLSAPIPTPNFDPIPSPSPTSQKEIVDKEPSGASAFLSENVALVAGASGGVLLLIVTIIVACIAIRRTKAKSAQKFMDRGHDLKKPPKRQEEVERPAPVARSPPGEPQLQPGENATGLV